MRFTNIFFIVFLTYGCAIGQQRFDEVMMLKVKKRAPFDFSCNSEIEVSKIDNATYGARGCGKQTVYVPSSLDCNERIEQESFIMNSCTVVPTSTESIKK